MKQIKKILFPTDFSPASDKALRYAIWLSTILEAEVQLLHVIYFTEAPFDMPGAGVSFMLEQKKNAEIFLEKQVSRTVTQAQLTHNLKILPLITSTVETGSVVWQLRRISEENNIDLIVMGTRGEHDLADQIMGSVASDTIKKASCPVLVVPPEFNKEQIRTVAYATDLSDTDPYHIWEALKIIEPLKPELKIVHALNKENDTVELERMGELKQYFIDNPTGLTTSFSILPKKSSGSDHDIKTFVEASNVDLLILYRPQKGFLSRLFFQSFTKNISLSTEIPILVLK